MTAYQCDRDGRAIYCPACGKMLRSSPTYDSYPFCKRVHCIVARKKRVQEDLKKEREMGILPAN